MVVTFAHHNYVCGPVWLQVTYEKTPNIPAFSTPKRSHQPSVSTAISGAAIAITKALGGILHKKKELLVK